MATRSNFYLDFLKLSLLSITLMIIIIFIIIMFWRYLWSITERTRDKTDSIRLI